MSNNEQKSFWDFSEDDNIDYHKWESDKTTIKLTKSIKAYKVEIKSGPFGNAKYIKVGCPEEIKFFKVESVRLRRALIGLDIKNYPCLVEITRTGKKFDTQYFAKIVKK